MFECQVSDNWLYGVIEDGSGSTQNERNHAICVDLVFEESTCFGFKEADHRHHDKVEIGLCEQQLSLAQVVDKIHEHMQQRLNMFTEGGFPTVYLLKTH